MRMVFERRKNKKRKEDAYEKQMMEKPISKDEYVVAQWIRNNVPSKKTKFDQNHMVEYFTGTRAVDALLNESPWSKKMFESRQDVVDFLETMLRHKFFHRAKKIIITEEELIRLKNIKKKGKDLKEEKKDFVNEKNLEQLNGLENYKSNENIIEEYHVPLEFKKEQKKKSKVRLEMHMDQFFVDCNDAYVWMYEPIPVYYWFFGTLLVLGAIGVCLFPLWPLTVRHGVWYMSIAAAGFLVFILSLIIVRLIIFSLIWIISLGRHHLWLFPNLVEDVGFFASFWPIYHYEYYRTTSNVDKTLKKKNSKTAKTS